MSSIGRNEINEAFDKVERGIEEARRSNAAARFPSTRIEHLTEAVEALRDIVFALADEVVPPAAAGEESE